jgi:phosphatidyl-myo-inositol dimannoside synthase
MRILIASADYSPDGGGIGAYASGLSEGLRQIGHSVHVLSMATPLRQPSGAERFITVRCGGSFPRNLQVLWAWCRGLGQELRDHNPHWVVVPTWDPVGVAAMLPAFWKRKRSRIALVFHGADIAGAVGRKAALLRYAICAADRVIANSEYTRGLITRRFSGGVHIVRPGITEFDLAVPEVRRSERELVSVGRLVPRKGQALVMRALARLSPLYPGLHYTVVGDGPELVRLCELARSLGVERLIRFTGHATPEEKKRLLGAASIFVLPILPDARDPEGFGIAYLEAGAAGLPVIATAAGGVTESVRDNESGLFCEPSVESVSEAISRLLDNRELRHRLGAGGRAIANQCRWAKRAGDLSEALA